VWGVAAAGIIAVLGGGFYPTLLAQEAKSITDQEACKTMKSGAHAADKSKAPKDVAEAEQWLRNDFAQAGESEIQFNLDTGNFSYKTKNDQMFSFNLVTLAQTTLSRDAATGAWRVTFTSYGSRPATATIRYAFRQRCSFSQRRLRRMWMPLTRRLWSHSSCRPQRGAR